MLQTLFSARPLAGQPLRAPRAAPSPCSTPNWRATPRPEPPPPKPRPPPTPSWPPAPRSPALDSARSVEAERYLALFSQAERIRLALLALGRLHVRIGREPGTAAETAILDRALELAARILQSISAALAAGVKGDPHPECLAELRELAERLREPHAANDSPALAAMRADARRQLDALTGQLASAVELAAHTSPTGMREFERREAAQPWSLRLAGVFAVLRANLTLESAAFRHALRLAVCVVIADTLTRSLGWQRAYWGPMTVAIVLKPDFTTTFSRGVLRLAGTFTGLALATVLFHAINPARRRAGRCCSPSSCS